MGKNVTTSLGNKTKFRQLIDNFGLPRVIITGFLLLLFISADCKETPNTALITLLIYLFL